MASRSQGRSVRKDCEQAGPSFRANPARFLPMDRGASHLLSKLEYPSPWPTISRNFSLALAPCGRTERGLKGAAMLLEVPITEKRPNAFKSMPDRGLEI
jgi:hypothetical protein